MKICGRCKISKPCSEFRKAGVNSRAKDGLQNYCKTCTRDWQRQHKPQGSVITPPEFKTCLRCRVFKPISEFGRDGSRKDGMQNSCKDCVRIQGSERNRKRSELSNSTIMRNRRLVPQGLKICSACKQIKPLDEYHYSKNESYGLHSSCKKCVCDDRRNWNVKNRARMKAYDGARYPKVKDHMYATSKIWRANNPEKIRVYDQRKRIKRTVQAEGKYSAKDIGYLLETQSGLCYYCGEPYMNSWHLEHKTPISRGGTNWPSNLCISCVACNQKKHTSTEEEFRHKYHLPLSTV